MRKVARLLLGLYVFVRALRESAHEPRRPRRLLPYPAQQRRGEAVVVAALLGTGLAGAAFMVVYVWTTSTVLLGACLAAALGQLALGLAIAGRNLVPQERATEQRPSREYPEAEADVDQLLAEGAEPLNRRRLLVTGGIAGCALGVAALTPLASLGPAVGDTLTRSPWRRGVALVNAEGAPIHAADLDVGGFLTAFPAGASREDLASPIVVCRVRPDELQLPSSRRGYAPGGLLAFSKICTHAGCAVSLFRYPLSPSTTAERPALVCPCHYSTFDVARGAEPIFGPAVRALPQLPLRIDRAGRLLAAGPMTGNAGPSWWGVRRR
jgi:ubiquinol-cytochrome c reductase iron-sulfur subunit